jgi:DNA-binding MarR family transcriptional regulator
MVTPHCVLRRCERVSRCSGLAGAGIAQLAVARLTSRRQARQPAKVLRQLDVVAFHDIGIRRFSGSSGAWGLRRTVRRVAATEASCPRSAGHRAIDDPPKSSHSNIMKTNYSLDTANPARRHDPNVATSRPTSPQPGIPPRHLVPAHLARRFHQICLGVSAEILEPDDLNPIEYAVLAAVDDHPAIDQGGLGAQLGIDPASTSQIVERLAKRDLLARSVDPADRRARVLQLTTAGVQLRGRLRPDLLAAQNRIMSVLSDDEQVTLIALLARLVERNDAYARPGNGRRKPGGRPRRDGDTRGASSGLEQG